MDRRRFTNPWPGAQPPHGWRDILRWSRERGWIQRRSRTEPPDFELATPAFHEPRAPRDTLAATWIGHSTVLVQMGGLNILTDPMWSERASPLRALGPRRVIPPGATLESLPPLDLVLLSHNHYDHLDSRTVRRLARLQPGAHWMVPLGLARLLRRFGVRKTTELGWWEEATIAGAHVACTPARHFSARGFRDRMRTLWCGWAVRVADHTLYFAGDTAYHPDFAKIGERYGPFDIVLLPIGAYDPRWFMERVHVDPEEAVRAYLDVSGESLDGQGSPRPPRIALGIHWGTFKLTDEPMDEPPRRARAAWRAAGLPDEELWIFRHGETRELELTRTRPTQPGRAV
ncbi:MAG TPA: MBL fold metallo-hydrolase [Gemmatimonadaceae bacterium]